MSSAALEALTAAETPEGALVADFATFPGGVVLAPLILAPPIFDPVGLDWMRDDTAGLTPPPIGLRGASKVKKQVYITVPLRKRAHYGILAHPPLWAQFPAKV